MKAWLFQDHRQKQKLGEAKAPWSVGWIDPEGRRKSKRIGLKSAAVKYLRKVEGQLAAGVYESVSQKPWPEFRKEFESKIASGMEPSTRDATLNSLNIFQRIVKPARISRITAADIDQFVSMRRAERGQKRGSTISPATVNRDLRHIKSTLRIAHDWGYLPVVPRIRMVKEPSKLARYVTAEHFEAIYKACEVARLPQGLPYPASDWWRAMLTFN